MAGNLCVSVGVSKYTSGLARLPGAAIAAKNFSEWASTAGYQSILISDGEGKAVTSGRIKHALETALNETPIQRLIFYFAGHGIAKDAANECWLLTHVLKDPEEAIARVAFYRQLQTYRIPQIAFFADACRTISTLSLDVNGRGILCNGGADRSNPQFDIFLAASLGDPALTIKGVSDSKSRCLFTEVVLDGLSGKAEAAIEQLHHPDAPAVLSHTLANFVETEANNRASLLNRISEPEIQAAFRAPNDVYLKLRPAGQHAGPPPPDRPGKGPHIPAPPETHQDTEVLEQRRKRVDERRANAALDRVTPSFVRRRDTEFYRSELYAGELYRSSRFDFRALVNLLPFRDVTGVIWSGSVTGFALPQSMDFERMNPRDLPTFSNNGVAIIHDQAPSLILTESRNGNFSSVPVFPRLLAVVTQSETEVRAINYLGEGSWEGDLFSDYADILGPLSAGQLRSGDANRVADRIRYQKHENPVFGVVAGYLYAATGDLDNIVRTANYYFEARQPVPFDLALLGASDMRWEKDPESGFRVMARFRSVSEVDTREKSGDRPYYAQGAFSEREEVPVSGFMPWLRQGWSMLLSDAHLEIPQVLKYVGRRLTNSTFTTMSRRAGRRLTQELGYRFIPNDSPRKRRGSR